ncbi:MAG: aldehyde dehydrogenase family protein, partial [Actinobacteria bacterium]|nr:aldehyde dehydrogenase family protein [Actinomycetota bacterium]
TGVTAGMRIATDELFAPVVVVIRASSVEDAFDAADATDFGLTAAIFTTDLGTAFRFVERAEVGAVQVNLPTAGLEYQSPVGGRRNSGSGGLEQGAAALDFYTRSKAVSIRFATDA